MDSTRSLRAIALGWGALLLVLNGLGAGPWRDQLWGAHLYGFLPWPVGLVAAVVLLAAAGQLARGRDVVPPALVSRAESWSHRRGFVLGMAVILAGVFWLLRVQHDLLGDALPLTHDLPRGIDTHPRQPLAMWWQQQVYQLLGPLFEGGGRDASAVAWRAVALGSVVCGGLFVPVAWKLGSWLTLREAPNARGWFTALLLLQGSSLLFFGYLENYTIYLLGVGAFLLAGVGALQGRMPLWVTGLVLSVCLGLHLSSFVLWPGFLLLVGFGLRDRRAATLRDLGITALGAVGLVGALHLVDAGFSLGKSLSALVTLGRGTQGATYLFSVRHLRDFSQEQLLVGPLSLLFFLPAVVAWVRRPWRDPASAFVFVTALTCLAAAFAADEPMLGYARDWDLFVPALLPLLVATIAWWSHRLAAAETGRSVLGFLVVLSVLSLAPWVAVNHSESRSLQRMAHLPLGLGREAVVVGNWHLRHGDEAGAAEWFERALREHPGNNNALNLLGNILLREGQVDRALALYEQAIILRPRKIEYRDKITRVLVEQKRYEESYPHFEALLRETPGDGQAWLRYAQALREGGQADRAQQTYVRAAEALRGELAREPDDFALNMDLGTVYASMGQLAEAEPYLRKAVHLRPRSATALYQLAGVLVETSRANEAREYLERLLAVEPDHPQRRAIEQWLSSAPR